MRVNIKALSVNECWKGRRFKTPGYKIYEWEVFGKLKDLEIPDGNLCVEITAGLSS